MADIIKQLVKQMESAFLSIFLDAASQMANLAESKLFVIFESSNGQRRIGGNDDLLAEFKVGQLLPRITDQMLERAGQNVRSDVLAKSGLHDQAACDEENEESSNSSELPCDLVDGESSTLVGKKRRNADAEIVLKTKRMKKGDGNCSKYNSIKLKGDGNEVNCDKIKSSGSKPQIKFDQESEDDYNFDFNDDEFNNIILDQDGGDDNIIDSPLEENISNSQLDEENELLGEHKLTTNQGRGAKQLCVAKIKNEFELSNIDKKRCKLCLDSKTYTRDAYRKHKLSVHDKKYVCLKCHKGFPSDSSLTRHLSNLQPCQQNPVENTSNESDPSSNSTLALETSI